MQQGVYILLKQSIYSFIIDVFLKFILKCILFKQDSCKLLMMIRMFSQNLYSVNKRMISSSNNKYLIQLSKFAAQLRKPNLKSIKNLTIYYPSTLGYDALSKEYQKNIAQALFNNCQSIQVVIIIATNIISIDGFAIINKKLKVIKDENWIQKQSW